MRLSPGSATSQVKYKSRGTGDFTPPYRGVMGEADLDFLPQISQRLPGPQATLVTPFTQSDGGSLMSGRMSCCGAERNSEKQTKICS